MRISDWSSDVCSSDLIPGGLIDVEFIAQHLRLVAPATAAETYGLSTADALRVLGEGVLSASDLDTVLEGLRLFTDLSQLIRLCVDPPFDPNEAPSALVGRVCRAVDCPDTRTTAGAVERLWTPVSASIRRTLCS